MFPIRMYHNAKIYIFRMHRNLEITIQKRKVYYWEIKVIEFNKMLGMQLYIYKLGYSYS
jgi:hypothetical protein